MEIRIATLQFLEILTFDMASQEDSGPAWTLLFGVQSSAPWTK